MENSILNATERRRRYPSDTKALLKELEAEGITDEDENDTGDIMTIYF
jgi:hypothetical protein